MKKLRFLPLLFVLSLSGCLAQNNPQPSDDDGSKLPVSTCPGCGQQGVTHEKCRHCGEYLCVGDHSPYDCAVHFVCEGDDLNHVQCDFCHNYICDGLDHSLRPCGVHHNCVDDDLNHGLCFVCGNYLCDGEDHTHNDDETNYGYNHYNDYYGKLTWENGEDLKNKLNAIIRDGYTALTYDDPNWETNAYADHSYDDFEYLDVVYSNKHVFYTNSQKGWQREHAFCASLMTGSLTGSAVKYLGRSTDFHNLFAADAGGNNSRGNKNFGNADITDAGYKNYTTDNGNDGYQYDPKTFEPATKDKGRLARAIFYMCTMYKDDELDTYNNVLMKGLTIQEEPVEYVSGNNCKFAIGNLSALLKWNNDVDVDYLEMQHNESVYSHIYSKRGVAQGNRNPYVDYPDLVEYVYGSKQDEAGDLKDLKPSCVDLESESSDFSHYAIKEAKREFTYGETLTNSNFSIVSVNKDYSYSTYEGNLEHSLLNHQFSEEDGENVEATISVANQTIKYPINLDPLKTCSYYSEMKKTGISNAYADIKKDNNVTYGDKNFTINIDVSSSGNKWTITDKSDGGFIMGSGTYSVKKVILKTVDAYTVDKLYMSLRTGNKDSSYTVKMYVGDELVYTGLVNDNSKFVTRGTTLDEAKTGVISYIFEGSTSLWLRYVAFNEVN